MMTQKQRNKMASSTVKAYEGNRHLLLIFASNENAPDYQQQVKLLDGQEDKFVQRDTLVAHLFADGESNMAGTQSATVIPLQLRERYNLEEDQFSLLLISKEGELHMRKKEPVAADVIIKQIDALA